jgi:hypothetical protein
LAAAARDAALSASAFKRCNETFALVGLVAATGVATLVASPMVSAFQLIPRPFVLSRQNPE